MKDETRTGWEELPRQVTDPFLVNPGPTWIIVSTRGKQTARSEMKARAIEKVLGADWIRTHFIDTAQHVTRPVKFTVVHWDRRMISAYPAHCELVCGRPVENGHDIVFAVRQFPDGSTREGWIHTGCAQKGVIIP